MLFNCFRIGLLSSATFGLLHMFIVGSFIYMYFPIAIIVWVLYSIFDEEDREYLRRNGIDPDSISWLYTEYDDYYTPSYSNKHANTYNYQPTQNWRVQQGNQYSEQYKKISKKCQRNFKINLASKIED